MIRNFIGRSLSSPTQIKLAHTFLSLKPLSSPTQIKLAHTFV
jgi:hypothetical protein